MEKKKRETEGKGEDPAGTAFPHGSHSTCKVEPERAEPGQNSRGLVNRTIVKHLPSFPFIYIYICIFFFFLSFFSTRSAPPKTSGWRRRRRLALRYMLISGYFHYIKKQLWNV